MPNIDYNIQDSKYIEGKVDNIKLNKKNSVFQCQINSDRVQFVISFSTPSKVQSITIKTHKTEKIVLYFITPTGQKIHEQQIIVSYLKEDAIQRKCCIDQEISKVKVVLQSETPKILGLNSLSFRSPSVSKPSQKKVPNFSKNQQFEKYPHSALLTGKKQSREIFNKRVKKNQQAFQVKDYENGYNTRKQKIKKNEQPKMQSLLNFDKGMSKKQPHNDLIEQQEMKNNGSAHLSLPLIQYKKEQIKVFQCVNQQWLEAQKRLQNDHKVINKNRLSSQITIRIFHNKDICFDIYGQQRMRMINIVQKLGAQIIEEPVDYCLLVANKRQSQKVAIAKKLKEVKIVRSKFIQDCKSTNMELDYKDYLVEL